MATFYGSDTYCIDDLQLIDTQVTDPNQLICQRLARRLQTPRGALKLINDDPDGGFDVRQYINAKMPPTAISAAQAAIQSECLKDEEVQAIDVVMSQPASGMVSVNISGESSSGPFTFVLNVGQLTTQLIFGA